MAVLAEHVHRLTVDDYLLLVGDDEDGRWERTELVEGVVYDMSPESALHAEVVHELLFNLRAALPAQKVRIAGSIEVGPDSLWDPDVYVLRPGAPQPPAYRPYPPAADVELVVEVAVTSLRQDSTVKYRGYAAAGIPQYWIVVPGPGGYAQRHRDPDGGRYRAVDRFELPGGHADLDVATLLA